MQSRILIIEKDPTLAEMIQSNLKRFDYDVLPVAGHSADAIHLIEENTPDLVILDLKFTDGMDGVSLAEEIHNRFDIPLVFLIESSRDLSLDIVEKVNPYGFVIREFDEYRFKVVISIALQKYKTEKRLRGSEERLRTIANFTYDMEYWLDEKDQFVYMSPSVFRVTGYPLDVFIENPGFMNQLIFPEDVAKVRNHLEVEEKQPGVGELKLRIIRKDGQVRWIHHICQPVIDESGVNRGRYATNHDITEQHNAETTLVENERRYRSLFEDSRISLWEEDVTEVLKFTKKLKDQGISDIREYLLSNPEQFLSCISGLKVIDMNKACLVLYKAPDKETLISRFGEVFGKSNPAVLVDEIVALSNGNASYDGEGKVLDLEGNFLDVIIHWSVTPDSTSENTRILVSIIDVTARRQRERSLEVISTVSAAVRLAKTRNEMLYVIGDQITQLFNTDGWLAILGFDGSEDYRIEHATGKFEPYQGRILFFPPDQFPLFFSGDKVLTFPAGSDVPLPADWENNHQELHRLICPLVAEEHNLGSMVIGRVTPFTSTDLELIHSLSNILAVALYRTNLLEKTRKYAEHMATISNLGRRLSQTLEYNEVLKCLAEGVLQLYPDAGSVIIASHLPEKKMLTCDYAIVDGECADTSSFVPMKITNEAARFFCGVMKTQQPAVIDEYDEKYIQAMDAISPIFPKEKVKSGIYIPLTVKDEILGVLQLQSRNVKRFTQSDADLLIPLAYNGAIAIKNSRLFAETQNRLKRLSVLRTIDLGISSDLEIRRVMNVLVHELMAFLAFKAVNILLLDPARNTLQYVAGRGFDMSIPEDYSVKLGEGMAGKAALEGRVVIFSPSGAGRSSELPGPLYNPRLHKSYVAVPLYNRGQVRGVIEAYFSDTIHLTSEWLQFLETVAGQLAVALDNNTLVSELQRSNLELTLAYDTTLEGWSRALDLRDKETDGHSRRVTELTVRLAEAAGIPEADMLHIRRGALLHDIGKMGIPDSILLKEGPLTEEEWVTMRKHPVYAFEMLSPIGYLSQSMDIPYCHHEHWDGRGYPRGLVGEQIPLAARVFAIVDVYDSLVSDRPYRKAWTKEKALEQIKKESGTHLDARLVDLFLKIME